MEKQISSFSIYEIIIKIKEDHTLLFIEMQNTISQILNKNQLYHTSSLVGFNSKRSITTFWLSSPIFLSFAMNLDDSVKDLVYPDQKRDFLALFYRQPVKYKSISVTYVTTIMNTWTAQNNLILCTQKCCTQKKSSRAALHTVSPVQWNPITDMEMATYKPHTGPFCLESKVGSLKMSMNWSAVCL